MSVAFRREGDDEHLEPKFEIPIPLGPNLVTPRGLVLIGERVSALEARLSELAGANKYDPLVKSAKRELRYWQTRQVTAEVVPAPSGEVVEIGATVTFRLNGKSNTLTIVGDDEADPTTGSVSFSSPLARALMGAEVGEFVDFADREDAIEVLKIAAN